MRSCELDRIGGTVAGTELANPAWMWRCVYLAVDNMQEGVSMAKMRRTVKMLVPALGLSLVLTAYGQVAGQGQPQQGQQQGQMQAQPQAMPQQGAQPMAGQPGQQQDQQRRDMRLSQLIGMDVRDAQGENLGDINDVIVDLDQNRAMYAVIGFGGFLGMGERLFAFPLHAFQMPLDQEDRLVLNVSRERLKDSPGFDRNAWPDWNDTAYRGDVDRFYGAAGTRGVAGTAGRPGAPGAATGVTGGGTATTGTAGGPGQPGMGVGTGGTTTRPAAAGGMPAGQGMYGGGAGLPQAGGQQAQQQAQQAADHAQRQAEVADQAARQAQQAQDPQQAQQAAQQAQQAADAAQQAAQQAQGQQPRVIPPGTQARPGQGQQLASPQQARQQMQQQMQMVRGSDLLNRTVRDQAGENVGDIDDVVVNMADGELRYAVIGFSQGWFRPDQLVAVPIEALARSAQHPNDVMVTATRQQLENAPVFDKDRWPNFRDEQYQSAWNRFMDQFRGGTTSPTTGVQPQGVQPQGVQPR
jgi:sporulation protein YlmC with PRC-barrel domain